MLRGPGMMPQQRQQQFNPHQQQQFQQGLPPQFQQQQRQPQPIIHDDRRNPMNHPINPLATFNDITVPKVKTEKDYRKGFTTYEAYVVSPTKNEKEPKDKKSKGTTWTKASIIEHHLSSDVIATTVKELDAKESVTKKISELGSNQSTQVSNVLGKKLRPDRDMQFEWTIAQLEKSFNVYKNGKKSTRSITVYLKKSPKPDVDCEALYHRLSVHRQQHQAQDEQQQGMTQHHQQQMQMQHHQQQMQMQMQQAQQQQQMNMQRAQQDQAERMNPQRVMGSGGPGGRQIGPGATAGGGGGGGRVHGGSPAGVRVVAGGGRPAGARVVEVSDTDSKSSGSNSDTNSDSDFDSESDPSSINSSRSGRRRKDKQYYGRGNARGGRSRSRNRNKDYTVVSDRRRPSLFRRHPAVPESPRERNHPPVCRNLAFGGIGVEVRGGRQSEADFFRVNNPESTLLPQRRVSIHQKHPDTVSPDAMMADTMLKYFELGLKTATQQANVQRDALSLTRPAINERDPTRLPRPTIPHYSVPDSLDQRTRQAEALQRRDDIDAEIAVLRGRDRMRDSRSPFRNMPRDSDGMISRRFLGGGVYDGYSVPMSPSLSSGSSDVSYSSREDRGSYAARSREYANARGGGSRFGSDKVEYDFIGRDEANPFRSQRQPLSRGGSRPPPSVGRTSSMAPHPHDRRY